MEKAQPIGAITLTSGSAVPLWGALLLFSIWAALFGVTVREIFFADDKVERADAAIGALVTREGTVQFRPADLAIWNPTGRSHRFYEGDMVATGESSRAVVRFEDGRELEIAANSQIALRTESDKSSSQYGAIVTLLRGNLATHGPTVAAGETADSTPLRIVTGNQTFTLNQSGSGVAMEKARGNAMPVVKKVEGKIEVRSGETKATLRQDGDQVVLVTENAADQSAADAAFGELITEIKGLESRLAPLEHSVYWTSSLAPSSAPAGDLQFNLQPPARKLPRDWAPALRIAGTETPDAVFVGKPNAEPQRLSVPVSALLEGGVPSSSGNLGGVDVTLEPGARILNAKSPQSFAAASTKLIFRSMTSLPRSPVLLQVDRLANAAAEHSYLLTESEAPDAETAVQLHFKSGKDFAALTGILASAGRFHFDARDLRYSGDALYFVRDGLVIGMLQAPAKVATTAEAVSIANRVHADILYRGAAEAFLPIPKDLLAHGARLRHYVGNVPAVYVLSGAKVVRVSSSFIESEASVVDFIARSGSVFLKPVEIIPLSKAGAK